MTKYVYDFHEGNKDMKDLLGGKGANLAEMTNMGLPVPHGFTITTEACLAFLAKGGAPPEMLEEAGEHLGRLQDAMGKRLGDAEDPLLVSVRSGAKFSMPGMMDTVLNLGLNDGSVHGLAQQTSGDVRFARDAYRRFIQMFGKIVMDVPGDAFEHALDEAKERKGPGAQDTDLDADDLAAVIERFRAIYREHTREDFPQDPKEQLRLAIDAVFRSWNGKRARDYRRQNKISDDLGTAVNVQAMVFGNRGEDSGTGVAFTRDPATGENVPYGDYLANAQGEDVVAGIRNTLPLAELERLDPVSYGELIQVMHTLEMHYRDMCDIEFTIEKGRLWILQTRIGKRTAFGEWVMAYEMLEEGLVDADTALLRVDANRLEELFKRTVKAEGATPIATGLNASPGAATGKVVFSADEAEAWAKGGERVILVRRETTPDDYHGMIAAQGILTSAGGTNSHAAVVARGEGIPAVCGADGIKLDMASKTFSANGTKVAEGDVVTIDGFTGNVYVGELPLEDSLLEKARGGDAEARRARIWKAFERLMAHTDARRRLRVRANADTPDQSTNARERGAEGIGLCRTEHMFLGQERVAAVQQMIFAETAEEEQAAYDVLLPLQRGDFVGIFRAMSGLPVTVRLLDPPLHEFLPNQVELAVEVAIGKERGEDVTEQERVLRKVNELHEANPMLGLRGVRLGIVKPGLYAMQVRAIIEAAVAVKKEGADPKVEIMIPLVATKPELEQMRAELEPVAREILDREGVELDHLEWGTMIEVPRAAVTAGEIADVADFFSFGTNDLTQMGFGFSRDDIGKFVGMYEERKLVPANPFVTVDRAGVGRLMRMAVEEGKAANPGLHLGICGEHGGDPASVAFCDEIGLDYVSCSPFRIETARLSAGQAVVGSAESASK
ncbi:MAG: pyruvate, phosphate dikinase [Actinobacteria bacterium RBG_19FT_COMBO_70_19]|nr:MAG: pyruvate, phosphate dikinase [Actinobacteria bacterium RBG_19FT_COMBO_70_19]